MALTSGIDEKSTWDIALEDVKSEFDQTQRSLKEINLMLEQSQAELNKLSQRNTAITVHIQQVQAQFETLPRADIRMAYDAALDAQHRLFVMRGQLEKLQSDQAHLQRLVNLLERTRQLLEGEKPELEENATTQSATVEMLINTQEAERKKLSRQMHDGPAQALSNFILQTEIALRLFDIDQARAREELNNLKISAMNTFQKVRNYIFDLRPMMLDDLGLLPTIKKYGESIKDQTGIDVTIIATGTERRLEPYLEVMIFRALQELVGNAIRHGQGTNIKVQVNVEEAYVRVSVEDNGKGFSLITLDTSPGLGLKFIRERVELLGGTLDIDSTVGQGARISFQIPFAKT